jgi:hypothetical protein
MVINQIRQVSRPQISHRWMSPSLFRFWFKLPIAIKSRSKILLSLYLVGASVEDQPTVLIRLLAATGKMLLWVIQNPEWALKWALTILAIKLFLSEGFTLEALQKLQKPEPKLPIYQLLTNQPAPSPP